MYDKNLEHNKIEKKKLKKLSKSCQKLVKKCSKICYKVDKKLAKSWQKVGKILIQVGRGGEEGGEEGDL
jgi:hypothetical protein